MEENKNTTEVENTTEPEVTAKVEKSTAESDVSESKNALESPKCGWKKYWKMCVIAVVALAVVATAIVWIVLAGKPNSPEKTTPEETTDPDVVAPAVPTSISMEQLKEYEIIYSRSNSSQEIPNNEIPRLFNAIRDAFNVTLSHRNDLYYEGVESLKKGQYEILIGHTNREESATFLADLKWDDYGYGMVGDKIVVAGKNEDGTIAALRAFVEYINASEDSDVFFNNADKLLVQKSYPQQLIVINGIAASNLSILCKQEVLGGMAEIIRQAIIDACGISVPIIIDGETENLQNAIVLGDLAEEGIALLGNEYCFSKSGTTLLVSANTAAGYQSAAVHIAREIAATSTQEVNLSLEKHEGDDNIAVMSFNLMAGKEENRINSVLDTILKYRPAVVGVQEATDTWIGFLRQRLGDTYTIVGEGRGSDGNEYSAVLYLTEEFDLVDSGTKWLSETPDQKGSKLEESHYVRIMTYVHLSRKSDGKQFLHANTHLDYTLTPEEEATQVAQMQILFDELAKLNLGDIPTVITGDFNAKADSLVYEMITSKGFKDSCPEFLLQAPTYHGLMGTTGEPRHIDFIFEKGLANDLFYRICTERQDNENVSDHYPILAVLSFQTEN